MELEELKEAWAALDNRLKKNEKLNESIILEMMQSKTRKLLNKVIALETIATVVAVLVMLLCIFHIFRNHSLVEIIFPFFFVALCLFHFFWGNIKINGLKKINLSNNVGANFYYMNRYSIQLKRERKIYLYYVLIPLIIVIIVSFTFAPHTHMFGIFIFPLLYWTHLLGTSNYHKNIGLIIKSLEEIRELKEE